MTFLDFAENYFKFNARSVSLCPEQSAFADIPFEAVTIRPTYQISSNHKKMYFWIRQTSPTKLNKGGHKKIVTWRLEFGNFVIECGQKAMLKLNWRWTSSDEWMKKDLRHQFSARPINFQYKWVSTIERLALLDNDETMEV